MNATPFPFPPLEHPSTLIIRGLAGNTQSTNLVSVCCPTQAKEEVRGAETEALVLVESSGCAAACASMWVRASGLALGSMSLLASAHAGLGEQPEQGLQLQGLQAATTWLQEVRTR